MLARRTARTLTGGCPSGPACASAAARSDTVPLEIRQRRSAEQDDGEGDREGDECWNVLAHRGEDLRDDLAQIAGQEFVGARRGAARPGRCRRRPAAEQDLQGRFGDELHRDEGQFAAATSAPRLSVALRPGNSATSQFTFAVFCRRVPSIDVRERRVGWRRLLAGGIVATALIAIGGGALELWWFGASDAAAGQRAERAIHQRFDAMVRAVTRVSELVGSNPAAVASLSASTDNARPLFDLAREARRTSEAADRIAVTIYDQAIVARAWAGAPSDIPNERISAPSTLFVTPSPLGLRLVHLRPIVNAEGARLGAVATEHVLSPAQTATILTPTDLHAPNRSQVAYLRTRSKAPAICRDPGW